MKAKIIIAIVAIIAILGGTFAGLWFFTDVFNFLKPENEVFSNQVEKALNLEEAKFTDYSNFLEEYKEMSNKPVSTKLNITADLDISEIDSEVQDVINKSKITIESNSDIANKKAQAKIGLYTDNKEVLTLDTITDGEKIAVGSEALYDKYLTLSFEDLVELLAEESDVDAEELEELLGSMTASTVDPYKLLYISEDDLKHFDETYRDCLKSLISEDCFTSEKKVEVEVDGEDVKTTAYYLTMTGEDMYNFVNDLLKLIEEDDVIAKIVTEKVNYILESAGEEKVSEDDVKELISELTKTIVSELETLKEEKDTAIQIAIYSKSNNPVRIDFNVLENVEDLDEKETLFSIEYAEGKTIYSLIADESTTIQVINEYEKNSDEEKVGKFVVKAAGVEFGSLSYELIDKKDESKIDLSLDMPMSKLSSSSEDLTADIEISTKGDYTKEEVTLNGLVSVKYGSESIALKFDGSMNYGKANIPEITSKNSVDIGNLDDDEMEEVLLEILENAAEVLPERLELLGIEVDSEDILPSTVKPNTNTNTNTTVTTPDLENDKNEDVNNATENKTETNTDANTDTTTEDSSNTEFDL